jgi:hypothetical protein
MNNDQLKDFVLEGLATANNYFCTGRSNKAIEMLSLVGNLDSEDTDFKNMMRKVYCLSAGETPPDMTYLFGEDWNGQDLTDKSIEIFCDQGMGDTINLLRYVKKLKEKYDCKIVLNYYAFFNQFETIISNQKYIDKFTPFHVKCDYHTNIMSIPAFLNDLKAEIYYPTDFEAIMKEEIPDQISLGNFSRVELEGRYKIGLVWQTNSDNPLSEIKSVPVRLFSFLCLPNVEFYCLQPDVEVPEWINTLSIKDLKDTASFIQSMDCVISVDTVVLHLAGALGKKTFGLIPFDSDPRWDKGDSTIWYPSVELFRQPENKQWSTSINSVRDRLVAFLKTL